MFCLDFWALIASSLFNKESMVWVSHSSSVLKVFGALMLLVHWWDFWHSSIRVFRWVSYRSFNLLPGFMKRNVLLIFHFNNFLFDLPFRATSHICWMIAITIGTFCFIFTFMIVMSSLSTFWFVLAESFIVTIFLTIKTTLWIWNVNLCVTNHETNFDLRGYVWTISGQYVWRHQLPILSPLHAFNFGYFVIPVHFWCPLHPYFSALYIQSHFLKNWVCSKGCHFNRIVNQFVSSEKIIAVGFVFKMH